MISFRGEIDESDIELFVEFRNGAFHAESSAWFSHGELKSFIEKLAEYPLRDESKVDLIGGIWDHGGAQVVQGLIEISVKPSGDCGQLSVSIRLTELDDENRAIKSSAFTSIGSSYQEIEKIRSALIDAITSPGGTSAVLFQDFIY